MRKIYLCAMLLVSTFILSTWFASLSAAADAPRMSKDELLAMRGSPDLVLIDVRTEKEWRKSDKKIVGAIWQDSEEYAKWAGNYPKEKTVVLYCS